VLSVKAKLKNFWEIVGPCNAVKVNVNPVQFEVGGFFQHGD